MYQIPDYMDVHDDLGTAKDPRIRDVKTGKFVKKPKPKK